MDAKYKLKQLYTYIDNLCALKRKQCNDYDKEEWVKLFEDINSIDRRYVSLNSSENEEEVEDYLLHIEKAKVEYDKCPILPDYLKNFVVNYKFKNINSTPKFISYDDYVRQLKNENMGIDYLKKYNEHLTSFKSWISNWEDWSIEQKKRKKASDFFEDLYYKNQFLNENSDVFELVLANGVFYYSDENSITQYPILLKKCNLFYDAENNIIDIRLSDKNTEFYTSMIENFDFAQPDVIKKCRNIVNEKNLYPLNKNDISSFFKSFVHTMDLDGEMIINKKDVQNNHVYIIDSPMFLVRKKTDGIGNAIEKIVRNLDFNTNIPQHLLDLIGEGEVIRVEDKEYSIEEQLAAISGESYDVLLSKQANKEQLEIAENIEKNSAVLVQGPPGTGKTHTIANLLGHFLSKGESVLITSQTQKALKVVKDKVPKEIQDLCVPVFDDSYDEMNKSINGISEKCSKTATSYKKSIALLNEKRINILDSLFKVRRSIYNLKHREVENISFNGESYSPMEIAKYVNEKRNQLDYIPGNIAQNALLPLSYSELSYLYKINDDVTENEEQAFLIGLPKVESLVNPDVFANYVKEKQSYTNELSQSKYDFLHMDTNKDVFMNLNSGPIKICNLKDVDINSLKNIEQKINCPLNCENWILLVYADGKDGGNKVKKWEMLEEAIHSYVNAYENLELRLIGKEINLPQIDFITLKNCIQTIQELLNKKGKVPKFTLMMHKDIAEIMENTLISNEKIGSIDDCKLLLDYIDLIEVKNNLEILWNNLFKEYPEMNFDNFKLNDTSFFNTFISKLKSYLSWYTNYYLILESMLKTANINVDSFIRENMFETSLNQIKNRIQFIQKDLTRIISFLIYNYELNQLNDILIHCIPKEDVSLPVFKSLKESLINENYEAYKLYFDQYSIFYTKNAEIQKRNDLLDKLEKVAPLWADKIKNREYLNEQHNVPDSIFEAWKWKQFSQLIDDMNKDSLNALEEKAFVLSEHLHKITAELASNMAWYHLVLRIENNPEMKNSLGSWNYLMKKIGKGTGKRAKYLRKDAQEYMTICQKAVPAWIMPMNAVINNLDPIKNKFDVVIVDEASQSDLSSLIVLYMANKVIIVGDDKQVSPSAVGIDVSKSKKLQDTYLKDVIPGYTNYDEKTSLYDIAKIVFRSLMLKEHFRCVPEIIGFSNQLSYDNKILPLRDDSECIIRPFIVPFKVNGIRASSTNVLEAKQIVALIQSAIEQKEYKNQTFGVISLLGNDQVKLIQKLMFEHLQTKDIDERKMLVSDASGFQGDERDIIFISLVDSNNNSEGPLRKVADDNEMFKQRYNVAASRARNQLWIVHSMDYKNELKPEDIRRDLLEYAYNSKERKQKLLSIEQNSDSIFEESVAKALVSRGFRIKQQWHVGAYRIDMVVLYQNKKIAIECDGERWHSGEEKIKQDMERQAILERMGWRFIRIRGSQYFSNPDKTIDDVVKELNKFEIYPESVSSNDIIEETDLLNRIKIRANILLREWYPEDFEEKTAENNLENEVHIEQKEIVKAIDSNEKFVEKTVINKHKSKKNLDLPNIDDHVQSKAFGIGKIIKTQKEDKKIYITVRFKDKTRKFIYPDVYEKGLIEKL